MGRAWYIFGIAALLIGLFTDDAEARNGRQNQVPQGSRYGCDVCHTPAGGLNDFGFDSFNYTSGGTVDWGQLAALDSDRDGYPNGLELGDPNGSWSPGDGPPSDEYSHPGDRDDGLCGNGTLEGEEECEAGQLGGASCGSLGLGSGTLSCSSTCRYDPSSCDTCGDDTIQGGEECDGSDLAGMTCEELGQGTGTLECTGCSYNTAGCSMPEETTPDTCGDGVRQVGEECDGADHGGETCQSLGFDGGNLGCAVRCTFNTAGCTSGPGDSGGTANQSPAGSDSPPAGYENPSDESDGSLGPETKIELDGHACTTSPSLPSDSAPFWIVALVACGLVRRPRREV